MTAYFRTGEAARGAELLQIIEDQYAQIGIKDLGLEATIVASHLGLGRKSVDLCGGTPGTVVCRYDKTIIWDVKRGYRIGTTQRWIDEINSHLVQMGWVDSEPTLFKDILHPRPSFKEAFSDQTKPMYAIALFHETYRDDDAWIRVLWKNIYLPKIEADYMRHKWGPWDDYVSEGSEYRHATQICTEIMLEDEPIASDYAGPKICTGYIKQAASEGRSTAEDSFTLRVPLQIGVKKALLAVEELAYRIYFAKNWEEAGEASGVGLYWPEF